jgi:hypothetical protein
MSTFPNKPLKKTYGEKRKKRPEINKDGAGEHVCNIAEGTHPGLGLAGAAKVGRYKNQGWAHYSRSPEQKVRS